MSESIDELTIDKLKQKLFVSESLAAQLEEEIDQYKTTIDQQQATIASLEEGLAKLESSTCDMDEYNPRNAKPVEAQLKNERTTLQVRMAEARGRKRILELRTSFENLMLKATSAHSRYVIVLNELRVAWGVAAFCSNALPVLDSMLAATEEHAEGVASHRLTAAEMKDAIAREREKLRQERLAKAAGHREMVASIANMSISSPSESPLGLHGASPLGLGMSSFVPNTPPPKLTFNIGSSSEKKRDNN